MRLPISLATVVVVALFAAAPGFAQPGADRLAAAEQQCGPGREARAAVAGGTPVAAGAMPWQIPGAVTVSPREAQCMIERMGLGLPVVAAMRTPDKIPGTLVELPQVAGDSEEIRQAYAKAFAGFTGGEKDTPMLFYCHHERCQLSVLAVQRALDAGYRKLYWLRAGNAGWVSAGLPLENEVSAKAAAEKAEDIQRYVRAGVRSCGFEVTDKDFVAIALKSPTDAALAANLRAQTQQSRNLRVECLQILRKDIAQRDAQNPALAEIDALVARTPGDVDRAYQAARARIDAAPAVHFKAPLDRIPLPALSAAIDSARQSKSVRQICGTFDRPMPVGQAQWNAAKSSLDEHRSCLDRLEGRAETAFISAAMGERSVGSDFNADEAIALLTGSARYRCSVHASPACLPDASWDRVAAVATPANIAAFEKARSDQRNRADDIATLRAEANDWVRRFNAYNEQRDTSSVRSGGSAQVPSSNTAPPVRRAYGSSASGIK